MYTAPMQVMFEILAAVATVKKPSLICFDLDFWEKGTYL
jgi:hypothetical protein